MNVKLMRTVLSSLLLLCLFGSPASPASPSLSGQWVLDEDKSDDPRKSLKGLAFMREGVNPEKPRAGDPDLTDKRYWSERDFLAKQRAENSVADVGLIRRILEARQIEIVDGGASATVQYDNDFKRSLTPTDGGPVYSAKGDEYQPDAIGLELSYRRDGKLIIETMLKPRGRMEEEFKLDASGQRLTIRTVIENPDWIIEARIKRVYAIAKGD